MSVVTIYMMPLSEMVAYAYDMYPPLAEITALKSKMGFITGMTDSTLHVFAGLAIFGIVSLVFISRSVPAFHGSLCCQLHS